MNLSALVISAGLSFFFLVVVFRPLELAFPAKPGQRFFRPAWFTDLCFFLGQYLLCGGLVLAVLFYFRGCPAGAAPGGLGEPVCGQPWWLQAVEVILLS